MRLSEQMLLKFQSIVRETLQCDFHKNRIIQQRTKMSVKPQLCLTLTSYYTMYVINFLCNILYYFMIYIYICIYMNIFKEYLNESHGTSPSRAPVLFLFLFSYGGKALRLYYVIWYPNKTGWSKTTGKLRKPSEI